MSCCSVTRNAVFFTFQIKNTQELLMAEGILNLFPMRFATNTLRFFPIDQRFHQVDVFRLFIPTRTTWRPDFAIVEVLF